MNGKKYDTLPVAPVDYVGFITDVDKQLKNFYHSDKRSVSVCYILAIFLGMFGAHHFYLGRKVMGCMYLMTFGLFGLGYIFDLFRIRFLVKAANLRKLGEEEEKTLLDIYLLWFPCGLLGFHYFYLHKYMMGVLYLVTGGIFGIGWIIDVARLPTMVTSYNNSNNTRDISLLHAYLFAIPPFGFIGAHQYYCHRTYWGVFYTCTLGMFGVGWISDFIRMPFLISRAEKKEKESGDKMYTDDVYLLWLTCGIIGVHHVYLRRFKWAAIYALTLGLCGIGWLSDIFRIPRLVKEHNDRQMKEEDITHVIKLSKKKNEGAISTISGSDMDTAFDNIVPSPRTFVNSLESETVTSNSSHTLPRSNRSRGQYRSHKKDPTGEEEAISRPSSHRRSRRDVSSVERVHRDQLHHSTLPGSSKPDVRSSGKTSRRNATSNNASPLSYRRAGHRGSISDLGTSEEDEPRFNIIRRTKSSESNITHTISLESLNDKEIKRRKTKRKRSKKAGQTVKHTSLKVCQDNHVDLADEDVGFDIGRHLRTGTERDLRTGNERDLRTGNERDLRTGNERDLRIGNERDLRTGNERDLRTGNERDLRIGTERDLRTGNVREMRTCNERNLRTGTERDLRTGEPPSTLVIDKNGFTSEANSRYWNGQANELISRDGYDQMKVANSREWNSHTHITSGKDWNGQGSIAHSKDGNGQMNVANSRDWNGQSNVGNCREWNDPVTGAGTINRNASIRATTPREDSQRDCMTDVDINRRPIISEGQNLDDETKNSVTPEGPVAKVITVKKSPLNESLRLSDTSSLRRAKSKSPRKESLRLSETSNLRRSISKYKRNRQNNIDISSTSNDLFPGSDPSNGQTNRAPDGSQRRRRHQ